MSKKEERGAFIQRNLRIADHFREFEIRKRVVRNDIKL
jgi:hypothetical protein